MSPVKLAAILSLSMLAVPAQDVLHYKFDGNCGTEAINYAAFSMLGNGTINGSLGPAYWTDGRWNSALAGSDRTTGLTGWLDTGWNIGVFTSDVSVSFWLRNRAGNPATISFGYPFGAGSGQFRCFIGANGRLFVGGLGSGIATISTTQDLSPLLNAGWTHVVLAVDATAGTATFYVNGVPEPPITLPAPVGLLSNTGFAIGAQTPAGASPSALETDEFLLTSRVIPAAEVMALGLAPQAGDGVFGTGCGAMLMGTGQRPSLGNTAYALGVSDPASGLAWVLFGTSRCTLAGTIPLPISLAPFHPSLTGCNLYVSTDLGSLGPVVLSPAAGMGTLPFPIPGNSSLAGVTAVAQALTLDPGGMQIRASNAVSIGLGL